MGISGEEVPRLDDSEERASEVDGFDNGRGLFIGVGASEAALSENEGEDSSLESLKRPLKKRG